jgi:predicted secreted protein
MSVYVTPRNGFGTVLSLCTQASTTGTFSAVAGITSMNIPRKSLGVIDVTYHGAPDSYDVAIPGAIFKMSPLSMSGIMITCSSFFSYTSAYSMYDMKTWMENGTMIGWKIQIGGTSSMAVFYGNGYVTAFGLDTPFDEKATFTADISVTGKPIGPADGT